MAKILIADDERAICAAFSDVLRAAGHTPLVAANGEAALRLLDAEHPAAAFVDVRMPGMNGLELLREIRRRDPALPVVVMTAHGTVETAMEAVRLGAFDYLGKPLDLAEIRALLARALQPLPSAAAPGAGPPGEDRPQLVGRSPAMQTLFKFMGLLTETDLTTLLSGESGVGKELVARGIHQHGPRRERPFVAVNCAAIPEQLLESELFGHERGAFTGASQRRIGRFEAAADGTLLLDEVSELPYALQGKLLRVLQERTFERVGSLAPLPLRARLIAASNRDLGEAVACGQFRRDLYHRLKLATLEIPPLRERREDIALLAEHFLHRANHELGKRVTGLDAAALARLEKHGWPGNVRELEHTLKRAVLVCRGPVLGEHDLDLGPDPGTPAPGADALDDYTRAARNAVRRLLEDPPPGRPEKLFRELVGRVERAIVHEALRHSGGNQVAAARALGLNRTTLRRKLGAPDAD